MLPAMNRSVDSITNTAVARSYQNSSSNSTGITSFSGYFSFPYISVLVILAGGTFNFALLTLFARRRSLRSSFGIYLINLLLIDATLAVVYEPLVLYEKFTADWNLGHGACVFRNYLGWVFQNLIILAHFLIALNRIWAVTFPFSYRTRHSAKIAVLLCLSVWLLISIIHIPTAVITTVVITRPDGSLQCFLDGSLIGIWSLVLDVSLFEIPIVLVIVAFPVVCYRSFFSNRKQRISPEVAVQVHSHHQRATSVGSKGYSSSYRADTSSEGTEKRRAKLCGRIINGSRTGLITLTLMTLSVIVCLLPNEIFYTVLMVTEINTTGVLEAVDALQRLTTVFDPLLIVLGNTELRRMVYTWCRC